MCLQWSDFPAAGQRSNKHSSKILFYFNVAGTPGHDVEISRASGVRDHGLQAVQRRGVVGWAVL